MLGQLSTWKSRLGELQGPLLELALDAAEDYRIRKQAARAVMEIADAATKLGLKPLAFGQAGEDPDDELKGVALGALWPDGISTDELFSVLGPPQDPNLFGSYTSFLYRGLVPGLSPADLPAALHWRRYFPGDREQEYTFRKVFDAVMREAWRHLDAAGVLPEFAETVWALSQRNVAVFAADSNGDPTHPFAADSDKRRRVLLAILPVLQNPETDARRLAGNKAQLLVGSDVPWLVEECHRSESPVAKRTLAQLMAAVFRPEHVNAVLDACEDDSILAREFRRLRDPVWLDSIEAEKQREQHRGLEEMTRSLGRPPNLPAPEECVTKTLEATEAGDADAWTQLILDLTLTLERTRPGFPPNDLTTTPGWQAADVDTRGRILQAARRFLIAGTPRYDDLLDTHSFTVRSTAALPALHLLRKEAPQVLDEVRPDVWQRWCPVVLARMGGGDKEESEANEDLLRRAYSMAPEAILAVLDRIMDRDLRQGSHVFVLSHLDGIWDERIAASLLHRARGALDSDEAFPHLLEPLLRHRQDEAMSLAASLVADATVRTERQGVAVSAAELLVKTCADLSWPLVWSAITADAVLGVALVRSLASHCRTPDMRFLTD
jgi:hypothetical protein